MHILSYTNLYDANFTFPQKGQRSTLGHPLNKLSCLIANIFTKCFVFEFLGYGEDFCKDYHIFTIYGHDGYLSQWTDLIRILPNKAKDEIWLQST